MDLIRKQRIRFTVGATLITAAFLIVLFGVYFGLAAASSDIYLERLAYKAAGDYSSQSARPIGIKFLYVEKNAYGQVNVSGDVSSFGSASGAIVVKAVEVNDGKFKSGDGWYLVKSTQLESGNTLYVVLDRTEQHTQILNTALLIVLLYLCAVALASLLAFLSSAKLLAPVAKAFANQRDLIANASHELKTPLTVIAANMSVIKSEPASTVRDNSRWIESVDSQIDRMQGLIQNMLELSKLEQAPLKKEWLNFSVLADCACLTFEPVCFEKSVEIVADIRPDVYLSGEKDSLERLLAILLDNAIKYCGEHGKIGLKLTADNKRAKLSVMNTGEAISKEDAEHVFDRFFRADGARKNDDGHSFGLGLSIASATVKAHGGTISCQGVDGKGTAFYVTLPIKRPKEKRVRERKQK